MTAADQLNQAPSSQPAADPTSDNRSQTFAFEHKVFSMAGGYFSYVKNTKDLMRNKGIGLGRTTPG